MKLAHTGYFKYSGNYSGFYLRHKSRTAQILTSEEVEALVSFLTVFEQPLLEHLTAIEVSFYILVVFLQDLKMEAISQLLLVIWR